MHQAGFNVHYLVGILEILGQLGISTIQLAGAKAHVALLQRGLFRTALFGPQALAFHFEQISRIAIGQRFTIFGQLIGNSVLGHQQPGKTGRKCHSNRINK